MKSLVLLLTIITLSLPLSAGAMLRGEEVQVKVNGLVCDFCARALESVFRKKQEVNAIDVNLDNKIITINFHQGQTLDDVTITQLVTDSGYTVEEIDRARPSL